LNVTVLATQQILMHGLLPMEALQQQTLAAV
jgi:hypothetical protein